jgi:hypothetical protein
MNGSNSNSARAEQESIAAELPPRAYHLGTDCDGREHYHSAFDATVWVVRDGELVHKRDLERSVVHWVTFVAEEVCGWAEREPVEESNGLAGIVADVEEAA